ncbi:hypothetical protein [Cloacibacterium caeni]|uniref:hypothetical protein n=1 Tax=Cloacibacterium caeni TaxID=2004710 RepID=UPI00202072D9|nr:hypothetical protein [Cloacibacterium caeni]
MNNQLNKIFNIYYINFAKVYEIKMMLSNIISIGGEIENHIEKGNEKELKTKLGAKFLTLFSGEIEGGVKSNNSDSKKVLETFEIKTTKSIILNEIIEKSKNITDFENTDEGELVIVDDVNLSLENDAELRTVKLFSNGGFKGMAIPGAEGFDINNLFNSMLKDYAYKMKGKIKNSIEEILVKIPLSFESEFESSYSVDDLFIGKVSLVGLYKGKIKINTLRNSFQFFQELGSLQNLNTTNSTDDEIQESQYTESNVNQNLYPFVSSDDEKDYHYIDLLAIVQNVNIPQEVNNG